MRGTKLLLQHTALVTLFSRANCTLCDHAKIVIKTLEKKRSFQFDQVNVMAQEHQAWKELYEYDVPVVHVQRVMHTYSKPNITTEARKLMHRFNAEQLESLIDEAEGHA